MKEIVKVGAFECPECGGKLRDNMDYRTVSCTRCCQTFAMDRAVLAKGLDVDITLHMESVDEVTDNGVIDLKEEVYEDNLDPELHRTLYGI